LLRLSYRRDESHFLPLHKGRAFPPFPDLSLLVFLAWLLSSRSLSCPAGTVVAKIFPFCSVISLSLKKPLKSARCPVNFFPVTRFFSSSVVTSAAVQLAGTTACGSPPILHQTRFGDSPFLTPPPSGKDPTFDSRWPASGFLLRD